MSQGLIPVLTTADDQRGRIRSKILAGLKSVFPIQSRSKMIELDNLRIDEKEFSSREQKDAILKGNTLSEIVKGTVRMKDKDGKVVDEIDNFTVARVPWYTPRHTLIVGGTEYSVSNQVRPKPGVYARKRANGILEANFNTRGGANFDITMDPEKGEPQLEYGTTKIPLYPVLRSAGVSHEKISDMWGPRLAKANAEKLLPGSSKAIDKLYSKVVPLYHQKAEISTEDKTKEIFSRYANAIMDPDVNRKTLGKPYEHVTPDSLLAASGKILKIFKNTKEVDDRDNLDFKALHSIDDFFKEVITLNARDIVRKTTIKMEGNPSLRKVLPSGPFTPGLLRFINTSQLAAVPTQTNPIELIDSAMRVTSLGEGGIRTERAIPMEARQVHATQIGALDPFRTPESFRAGIDIRAAMEVRKDSKGNIYVPVIDVKTRRNKFVRAGELKEFPIAFPNQELKGKVDALVDGEIRKVPASTIKYQLPHPSLMYGPTTNLVPFIESMQGNRAVMGSKMQTQALSLVEREAPYVQVGSPIHGESYEKILASLVNPRTPVSGTVKKIDEDYIYIQPDKIKLGAREDTLIKIPYEQNFPLAAKTYIHHDLKVKKGDTVTRGQSLADSNFTRNGVLALGKNLSVAYMPYHGANSNDAIVISEGAAKKLTSERMYKIIINKDEGLTFNRNKHKVYYGHNYDKKQYETLDTDGVIKPGTMIHTGDPLVLGLRKSQLSADDVLLGRLHKSLAKPVRESSQLWDHDHPGEVVDVVKTPKRIALTVKTKEPMGIGDKLCFTHETEVLTSGGWKRIDAVNLEDKCYTLNEQGQIELHVPISIHHYPTAGELYELRSQQVDLRVTTNHNLYVQPRDAKNFKLIPAKDVIGRRVQHKKNGLWVAQTPQFFYLPTLDFAVEGKGCRQTRAAANRFEPIPMDSWLKFLGVYIANGSTTLHSRKDRPGTIEYIVCIHSTDGVTHSVSGNQHAWIKSILDECGFSYRDQEDRFILSAKQLALYLTQFGHADQKYLPEEIFTYSKSSSAILLHALLGCDGHKTKSGSFGYTTVSKRLADDVQRLVLHAGWSANIKQHPYDNENWNTRYSVQIVRDKNTPQINHGHIRTQTGQTEKIVVSNEPVYGVTVPNHTLYVRVNGKPVWSGNSGRFGNKGVVSQIIPDDQMIHDEAGKVIDVIMTSAGVVSRTNPSQIIETAVGKVVEKTGKPLIVDNLTGRNNVAWAQELLKKHNIKDKETVTDPMTGKKIPGVMVGRQYILKLMKSTDTNYSARGLGNYDVNQQPTKGGTQSAKALGKMEFDALIGHNARNILREASTIKSQKNDEYWKAVQLGYPTPPPKAAFAYDKFLGMLTAAGTKVHRTNNRMSISPLTDEDVKDMSSGEVKEPKLVKSKDLQPERGGLFDPAITGGLSGVKWSHINLAEPIVNPIFREPVRRFLGLTNTQLDTELREKGGASIQKKLADLDLEAREKELLKAMDKKTASNLDNDIKQVKYIRALRAQGLSPDNAYIVSKIPVLPPVFRPILPGKGGQEILYGDINPLYRDLLYVNNQMKEAKKSKLLPDEEKKLRPSLNAAVGAVYGTNEPITAKSRARGHKGFLTYISGTNSPKTGYFHSKLMKRTQDMAGRGTIVPDSTLGMDEVGIPEDMGWEMYSKLLVKRLVQHGYNALEANKMVEDKHPTARNMLNYEIKERPVIVNRAPTLHRYNMVAVYPKLVPGKTIRVNPFIETGMGADYDGDSCSDIIVLWLKQPVALNHFFETSPQKKILRSMNTDYGIDSPECHLDNMVSAGYYTLHIRDFPRIRRSKKMKDNKETFKVPDGVFVFGYDDKDKKVSLRKVTEFSVHKKLSMALIRTVSGRATEVSLDDSLLGLNSETGKLERFSPGKHADWAIPRPKTLERTDTQLSNRITMNKVYVSQQNKLGAPEHVVDDTFNLTEGLGWLLGAIIGDGWITYQGERQRNTDSGKEPRGSTVGLANIKESIRDKFISECQSLVLGGKIKYKLYDNEHKWDGMQCDSQKIHVHNAALASALGNIFGHRRGAENKRLPSFFVTAPSAFLIGLFAGLIDTDGTVSVVKAKSKKLPQIMVSYTTISPGLATDVSTLALLLGIPNRITKYKSKKAYQISFSAPAVVKIAAKLPCVHPRKKKLLTKLVSWDFSFNQNNSKDDTVPMTQATARQLKELFKSPRTKSRYKFTPEEVCLDMEHGSIYCTICKTQQSLHMGRSTFNKLIKFFGEDKLKEIGGVEWFNNVTNPNIVWDYITEVVPLEGKHTAWDLTVPDGNTFMTANQLIVYDTMMVHLPIGAKAVDEAKGMTLSNLLFSDKSKQDLLVFPQHEAIMGVAHASGMDNKNKSVDFKNEGDAMKAYNEGKIDLGTRVKIGK